MSECAPVLVPALPLYNDGDPQCAHIFDLGAIDRYGRDADDANAFVYPMSADLHAWLTDQGIAFTILVESYYGMLDQNPYQRETWLAAYYSIGFNDVVAAFWYKMRWVG